MRYLRIVLHSNNFTVGLLTEDVTYVFEKYPLKELVAFKSTLRPMLTSRSRRPGNLASSTLRSRRWWLSASSLTPGSSGLSRRR